jgi:transposase InsO family protein
VVAGSEFVSAEFIGVLRKHKTKLRPNRARAPHLNGKVERSQQTDRAEFYALEVTGRGKLRRAKEEPEVLAAWLAQWQRFYNEQRPHGGIGGRTRSSAGRK